MSDFKDKKYEYAIYYQLIGIKVRGKLDPICVFKEYWYGRRIDRIYEPTQRYTSEQQGQKMLLYDAVKSWQTLDNAVKEWYNIKGEQKRLYGYHKYLSFYLNAHKPMIIYWGPLKKDASDDASPDAYISSDRFQGVQKLRALADYPSGFPYGAAFYHSVLDKFFARNIAGWLELGGGGASGNGYTMNLVAAALSSPTDAATYYFGSLSALAPQTTANLARVYIPKAGTIKVAYIVARAGTVGTNEEWSAYIRLNNTTDYLIQSLSSTANPRVWSNTGLSIAVSQGDYFEIKMVCPTWSTNPATVAFGGVVYVE